MKNQRRLLGIIVFMLLISCFTAYSGTEKRIIEKADSVPASLKITPEAIPEITGIQSNKRYRDKNTVLFGDRITFTVKNLPGFLKKMDSCMAGGKKDSLCPILLFINGMPVNEIRAYSINKTDGKISFELHRGSETLKRFRLNIFSSAKAINFSFGLMGTNPVATSPKLPKTNLRFISNTSFAIMIAMIILMLITFRWLVLKTNLIRVTHSTSKYSLGLAQLLFWIVLIAFSFIYIYILTDGLHPITGSVLTLLSISLTTSGGSRVVEKVIDPKHMYESTSESFIKDILSDDAGYSVHRVQMAIWTILLGLVFSYEVIMNLAMPQFDTNLLLLMGISSTGYIGLKAIEHTSKEMKMFGVTPPGESKEGEIANAKPKGE
jgi:hypothetical protein